MGKVLCVLLLLAAVLSCQGRVAAAGWATVTEPRNWSFPRDHGVHPAYRTEWWYFTGNLRDESGNRYGYQLTFFRQGVRPEPAEPRNAWSVRDVYLAHFAVSDVSSRAFRYAERTSRAGPGLAGSSAKGMDVWLLDWSARADGPSVRLSARAPEIEIELDLTPRKPVVVHGQEGFSRKGPNPGQASYYASLPRLATRGTLRAGARGRVAVTGTSWFDQEFGSNQLSADQVGWDWVSLHLSDGRDLMVYLLRRADGSLDPASSGTLIEPGGSPRHLPLAALRLEALERWRSPRSGAQYPSRWRLAVTSAGIDVEFTPWLPDQELVTGESTGVTYWEGAVGGKGRSGGREVTCEGYVELTGYGGRMGGLF